MDFKHIVERTNVVLTYPPIYNKNQILDLLLKYYRNEIKAVFTTCQLGDLEYDYNDDVSLVQKLQTCDGWIIIDDYLQFYNSKLFYRLNQMNSRGNGVIILSTFGVSSKIYNGLSDLIYQQVYLDIDEQQCLTWELLTMDPLCRLMNLGLYGKQKTAVFTENVSYLDRQLCSLKYPVLTWSFSDKIDSKLLQSYDTWTDGCDGIFLFCDVPPLNLDVIDTVYFVDGWTSANIWSLLYQSYIGVKRSKPLHIVVSIRNDCNKREYNHFLNEYDDILNVFNCQRKNIPVTICSKTNKLIANV